MLSLEIQPAAAQKKPAPSPQGGRKEPGRRCSTGPISLHPSSTRSPGTTTPLIDGSTAPPADPGYAFGSAPPPSCRGGAEQSGEQRRRRG